MAITWTWKMPNWHLLLLSFVVLVVFIFSLKHLVVVVIVVVVVVFVDIAELVCEDPLVIFIIFYFKHWLWLCWLSWLSCNLWSKVNPGFCKSPSDWLVLIISNFKNLVAVLLMVLKKGRACVWGSAWWWFGAQGRSRAEPAGSTP